MKRNLKDYGLLVLKGMGMGAADVRAWRIRRDHRLHCRNL